MDSPKSSSYVKSFRESVVLFVIVIVSQSVVFHKVPYDNVASRTNIVLSVINHGTFQIDAYHENTLDKAFRSGRYFSDKAPGGALLAALLLYVPVKTLNFTGLQISDEVVRYFARILVVSFPVGIMALLMFNWASDLVKSHSLRMLPVLFYALGTPAYPYSTLFYGAQTAAAFGFFAFLLIIMPLGNKEGPNKKFFYRGFLAGALASFSAASVYPAALLWILCFLFTIFLKKSKASILSFIAGSIPIALGVALYHQICFGGILQTGYQYKFLEHHAQMHSEGFFGITVPSAAALWGITFSVEKGLFYYAPHLLFGIAGLFYVLKSKWKSAALFCITIIFTFILFNSAFQDWKAGWTFGPRHLLPAIPYMTIGSFFFLKVASTRKNPEKYFLISVYFCLGIVSMFPTFLAAFTTPHIPLSFESPVFEFLVPIFMKGYSVISPVSMAGLPPQSAPAILFVFIALLMLYTFWKNNVFRRINSERLLGFLAGILTVSIFFGLTAYYSFKIAKPDNFERKGARAQVFLAGKMWDEAETEAREILRQNQNVRFAWEILAICREKKKEKENNNEIYRRENQ